MCIFCWWYEDNSHHVIPEYLRIYHPWSFMADLALSGLYRQTLNEGISTARDRKHVIGRPLDNIFNKLYRSCSVFEPQHVTQKAHNKSHDDTSWERRRLISISRENYSVWVRGVLLVRTYLWVCRSYHADRYCTSNIFHTAQQLHNVILDFCFSCVLT